MSNPIVIPGKVPGQNLWPPDTAAQVAAENAALLASNAALLAANAALLAKSLAATIIWRPGGVPSNNVVTTAADVGAALATANGAMNVFIDSSLAPAVVDTDWNGFGCATLNSFNGAYVFTIQDGSTISNFASMQGLFAICECVTEPAFAFAPNESLLLWNFATISLNAGALVPAIHVTAADQSFAILSDIGSLDNSSAPTVPVVSTDAGAYSSFYVHSAYNFSFLTTGNEIGGGPGSAVFWNNDSTQAPLTSSLFTGTLNENPSSDAANTSYEPASLPNWSGTAPTSVADALDRIAAKVGPIP